MIKLKDLLVLDDMKYSDTINPKHQKRIKMSTELIGEVNVPDNPFPENSSQCTRDELQYLINHNDGVIDRDFVKEGDDIDSVFKNYCEANGLEFDKKYYGKILKESRKVIMNLKYKYNRPRPHQLAEYYGLEEFEDFELPSMKTPSYPSGHSTQGHLMAELLGKKYPTHYEEFKKLSNFISKSRIMARAHYPSDCKFGEEVAMYIIRKIK